MTFIISLGLRQPKGKREIAIRKWFFEKSHISRNIQSAKLATFAFAICAEVHYSAYLVQPQGEGITVSFEKMWLCWKVSGKERERFRNLQFHQIICNICFWFCFLTNHGIMMARISHTTCTWKVKESGPDLHKKYIASTCNELFLFNFCTVVKSVTFISCYRINRFHFQFSKKWQSSSIAKIIIAICNLLSSAAKLIVFLLVINSNLWLCTTRSALKFTALGFNEVPK